MFGGMLSVIFQLYDYNKKIKFLCSYFITINETRVTIGFGYVLFKKQSSNAL